jgi:hypothetical protein
LEFITGILGAGIGSGIMAIVLAALQRKWKKDDEKQIDPKVIDALVSAQKVIMIDRVRFLGKCYIADGKISLDDKENLQGMHSAYKALGGNGHLDAIMAEVGKLPVVEIPQYRI